MGDVGDTTGERQSRITHEQARDYRARAWAFVFNCYKGKKAAHPGRPDNAKGSKDDRATKKHRSP